MVKTLRSMQQGVEQQTLTPAQTKDRPRQACVTRTHSVGERCTAGRDGSAMLASQQRESFSGKEAQPPCPATTTGDSGGFEVVWADGSNLKVPPETHQGVPCTLTQLCCRSQSQRVGITTHMTAAAHYICSVPCYLFSAVKAERCCQRGSAKPG